MLFKRLWNDDQGEDIAEYAMMLAILLLMVIGVIQAIGINAGNVLSRLASVLKTVA